MVYCIICSIFKGGDKYDPSNYRGISLLPTLAKVFDSILELRLRKWEADNFKPAQNQAGFRPNFSTADHIFTLQAIINKYRALGRKVYCAFIDFSKAFDTIDRSLLCYKLMREGISSKFLAIV